MIKSSLLLLLFFIITEYFLFSLITWLHALHITTLIWLGAYDETLISVEKARLPGRMPTGVHLR